jgi:hypothetical protein
VPCITLCLQLPNRKSGVNYFNKSSYFCSIVYKSQKLYFVFVLTSISAVSKIVIWFQTLLRFCVYEIRENEILFFVTRLKMIFVISWRDPPPLPPPPLNKYVHVAIIIFSVTKLYIVNNSIYNINFIILVHFISFEQLWKANCGRKTKEICFYVKICWSVFTETAGSSVLSGSLSKTLFRWCLCISQFQQCSPPGPHPGN